MDAASAANAPARAAANAAARQALRKAISKHRPTAKQLKRAKAAAKIAKALKSPGSTTPRQAAADLKSFLKRTGRFGSRIDKPAEIIRAQRALGVTADGIVGPKTRRAARQWGVVLPPRA